MPPKSKVNRIGKHILKAICWAGLAVIPAAFLAERAIRVDGSISVAGAVSAALIITVGLGFWFVLRRLFAPDSWNRETGRRLTRTVALALTLFALLVLATHVVLEIPPQDGSDSTSTAAARYGVIVDAGSSGTRAFVYKWWRDQDRGPVVEQADSREAAKWSIPASQTAKQETKGCVMAEFDEHDGCRCLSDLLDQVFDEKYVAADGRVDLWIAATAGVRQMKPDHEEQPPRTPGPAAAKSPQERAVHRARSCVDPERFNLRGVEVLTGEKEGVYAWLAVNDLRGTLGQQAERGIIEIGGASAQATQRLPALDLPADRGEFVTLELGGEVIELHSISLDLGKDVARSKVSSKPNLCDNGTDVEACVEAITVYIQGAIPNDEAVPRSARECGSEHAEFEALANPAYALANFNLKVGTERLSNLNSEATRMCGPGNTTNSQGQTLAELVQAVETVAERENAKDLCFSALYSHLLAKEGFGIDPRRVTPTLKIEDNEVSWTRGAMLVEAQRLLDIEAASGGAV